MPCILEAGGGSLAGIAGYRGNQRANGANESHGGA